MFACKYSIPVTKFEQYKDSNMPNKRFICSVFDYKNMINYVA